MTQNKTLKHRVRERMSKTGERYTAARRQVLAKAPEAAPETAHGPTGRPLAEWFATLDEWGARDRTHTEIARWLNRDLGVDGWWSQNITVEYEKHVGRRVLGQRGSTFSATGTKTVNASVDSAREAWTNEDTRRQWLPDVLLRQRPNRVKVVARFDVNDGEGRVVVSFDARAESRTMVAIEHEKLPDAETARRWTTFWRDRLKVLKELLEA